MKRRFLIASALATFSFPAAALEIMNFRSGLACVNPGFEVKEFGRRSVCVDTDLIHVTGQSVCIWDGEKHPCTWYGFEFEYRNANGEEEIICTNSTSAPGDVGGPAGVGGTNVTAFEYMIDLENGSGRYFNPQYSLYRRSVQKGEEVVDETVCRTDGRELFKFKFRILFPATR